MKVVSTLTYIYQWLIVQRHRLQKDGVYARVTALVKKLFKLKIRSNQKPTSRPADLSARELNCYQELRIILISKNKKRANRN